MPFFSLKNVFLFGCPFFLMGTPSVKAEQSDSLLCSASIVHGETQTFHDESEPESLENDTLIDKNKNTFQYNDTFVNNSNKAEKGKSAFARWWGKVDRWLEKQEASGIDTTYQCVPELDRQVYLGTYAYGQTYDMIMPMYMSQELIDEGMKPRYDFRLFMWNYQAEMELGIDYKGVALELPIPLHNRYSNTFGLAKNGSTWGARIRYKHMKGMHGRRGFGEFGDDARDYLENMGMLTPEIQPYIDWLYRQRNDQNDLDIFYTEAYYVFNHKKFSLGAALYADMVQKKSCGSFITMVNYLQSKLTCRQIFMGNKDKFHTKQLSLGLGYGYNFSKLDGRLVMHLSGIPMITFYHKLVHSGSYSGDLTLDDPFYNKLKGLDLYSSAHSNRLRFIPSMYARGAINYSFKRFIITGLINYRLYTLRNQKKMTIINGDGDLQINLCYRF